MNNDELNLIKSLSLTGSIFAISFLGFYFIWKMLDNKLTAWCKKTESDLDDKIVEAIRGPSKLILLSLCFGFSLQMSPINSGLQTTLLTGSKIFLIVSLFWTIERILGAFIYSQTVPATVADSTRAMLRSLSKVIVYSIGLLILLDTLGISITPLLASLGVGSVAIALAAQETLSNLFSGVYILLDKPFRIGDCIRIDEVTEGFVTKIGWRSTHIRLYANNVAVIPNSKIASSMITNFDFPDSETTIPVLISIDYASDLKYVEQVVLEVAFLVQNNLPVAGKNPPSMAFTEFGEFGIHFKVSLRAKRITDGALLKHEFIKALHARFKQEGLNIPFPQYQVAVTQKNP